MRNSTYPLPLSPVRSYSIPTRTLSQEAVEELYDDMFVLDHSTTPDRVLDKAKTARCKMCGAFISREIEAIDTHMNECSAAAASGLPILGGSVTTPGSSKGLAGLLRRPNRSGTRIIYRIARAQSR